MNVNNNQQDVLKTPELSYPLSLTPPPSYEEATRNDHYYQPQPWLPSTSTGYTSGTTVPFMSPPGPVFNVQYQCNAIAAAAAAAVPITDPPNVTAHNQTANNNEVSGAAPPTKTATIKTIPSVTITLDADADQRSMEIWRLTIQCRAVLTGRDLEGYERGMGAPTTTPALHFLT